MAESQTKREKGRVIERQRARERERASVRARHCFTSWDIREDVPIGTSVSRADPFRQEPR